MSEQGDGRLPSEAEPKAPDRSLGELVSKLGDDLSGLLTTQIEIAKVEMKQEATKAAKGAGMLGGAGVVGLIAVLMLSMAAAWAIAVPLNPWAGFLIVGLIYGAVAAVLAMQGKKKLDATNPVPETIEELQADRELAQNVSSS